MTIPIRTTLPGLIALAVLAGTPAASTARGPGGNCPDSVTRSDLSPEAMSFVQLAPGTTQLTPGTSAATNTDLDGLTGVGVNKTVSWSTTAGSISVRLRHRVSDSATSTAVCSTSYQGEVQSGSAPLTGLCAIRIINFIYPKTAPLYGAYRTDGQPKGQVKSVTVARSPSKGRNIRFVLDGCAGPGQTTKPLTLVFQANQILKDGYVQFEAQDGSVSPLIKVYNPYVP
ncbi:hypothetical protein [Ideonella alba]|uniref:Secreted protein n=1 Tax=Ideonella alba TaxID=2824118 RepID=A0A941BD31_9BURK|nr:hypothetical protein [Ideonella alba]MBQ0929791.1 hypothetical protein [Ideonella alba]